MVSPLRVAISLATIAIVACGPPVRATRPSELSADCLGSNPVLSSWLRETTAADTVALTALQAAPELYRNPSDNARLEILDWQERTGQAYDFMAEYSEIPRCLEVYHKTLTNTLLELFLGYSDLALVYVAIDAGGDYQAHLKSAGEHFANALNSSKATADEWDRLEALGFGPPD